VIMTIQEKRTIIYGLCVFVFVFFCI